jgi:lysozyme
VLHNCDAVDLSHHNGSVSWAKLVSLGVKAVILKASEGSSFVDDTFVSRLAQAKEYALFVGAYHFLNQDNVQDQFNHFLNTIRGHGSMLCALDYEHSTSGDPTEAELLEWVHLWVARFGRHPVIYGSDRLFQIPENSDFGNCPLWLANYNSSLTSPPIPENWTSLHRSYLMWQWTENLNGGSMDASVWNYAAGDMHTIWPSLYVNLPSNTAPLPEVVVTPTK